MNQNLYYLASPYSHPDAALREQRAQDAAAAGAALKRLGLHIFAPIPHGHALARYGLPLDFDWWQSYCRNVLDRCDGIIILTIPGWRESIGVTAEAAHMAAACKPVVRVSLEELLEVSP